MEFIQLSTPVILLSPHYSVDVLALDLPQFTSYRGIQANADTADSA